MLDYRDPISTKPVGSHAPTLPEQLIKAHPIASHPLRHQLNNEVHARPPRRWGPLSGSRIWRPIAVSRVQRTITSALSGSASAMASRHRRLA